LLKRLDEVSGDGVIKSFRGLLVFSSQMEKMSFNYLDWDSFIKESEETTKRQQSKEQLISEPKEDEKFIKYIPAYSPEKAYRKFIKDYKTAKPDGWLFLESNTQKLPETVFTTQVKGQALSPLYSHNSWIIFIHTKEISKVIGKIALVYCESISDEYEGNLTIRKIEITEKTIKEKLFTEKEVNLVSLNPSIETIKIDDIISDHIIEIVGLEYQLP